MKRAGFTMIELIFVIVILGILAAVAIPKLAATRTDAKISKDASDIATALGDMGSYYTAQGKFGKVGEVTNVKFVTTSNGTTDAKDTSLTSKVYFNDSADKSCLSFQGTSDGNLTIASESNDTAECKGLNAAVADLVKKHIFGGSNVSY
jgi:prepilin-type N-terminal cleavage/methylation domain-containing protein